MLKQKGSVLGATFLVAGTSIGGGMLALPVATGVAGFYPSLVMMLLGWAFMTTTALFLTEVNLWMEEGSHVITMVSRLLGPVGKIIAWLLYLFISYASLTAYASGGGDLFAMALKRFFNISIPEVWAVIIFVLLFGSIIYLGNVVIGRVNTLLMVGLIGSYLFIVAMGAPYVQGALLLRKSWGNTLIAVPLLLTIFSFQTIVPSLTIYLKQDGRRLRLSIVLGTTIALIVYVVWEWLVLGTVLLDGDFGLAAALAMGKPASDFLGVAVGSVWLSTLADFFAFFALTTSFLGIALGLFDFLADGLKIKKERWGSFSLGLLIAIPVLFFTLSMERVFLRALDASGGIGDSILNGLFPALMLWIGRYRKQFFSEYRLPGGKPLIVLVVIYALFVFTIEVLGKFSIIVSLGAIGI
ncbi:MAG: aromatic amino acid transport family protein [Chlamydiales bacterium]